MTPEVFRNALVLTGPTGSGKTALAVDIAERLGAEIISMDSMAVYRGLDVVAAKPTAEERRRAPHHLLDELSPSESASVAWWLERAANVCREVEGRGNTALFVGGTPLYLKALLHGLFDGPPADLELRDRLLAEAASVGAATLHNRLKTRDPQAAARLHPNDVRRVVRALEVWEATGRPITDWQKEWSTPSAAAAPGQPPRVLCLDRPRDELMQRIDGRVVQMIEQGLVEEIRALRSLDPPLSREAMQAVGVVEIGRYLDGKATLAEAVADVQRRSRRFAKRQLTWFRSLPECHFISPELTLALWSLKMK
jgi:tRNA dimethylallyltransferase